MPKPSEQQTDPILRETLERIAREELEITTLEPRNNDDDDFHTLAVWEIETVMERAYQKGGEDELARFKEEMGL